MVIMIPSNSAHDPTSPPAGNIGVLLTPLAAGASGAPQPHTCHMPQFVVASFARCSSDFSIMRPVIRE